MPKSKSADPPDSGSDNTSATTGSYRHPLVRHLRKCFRQKKLDREGSRVPQEHTHLALRVGPASFDRACLIGDASLGGLDTAGHTVSVEKEGTLATVGTERLQLMLRERKTKVHNEPAAEQLKKKPRRYAYVPEWGSSPLRG